MFEIGNSLREVRVRQGLDFTEVELATKVRAKYIRALEEEDFEILPGETYIKGFLRAYADFLGLDGQLYVDEYASRFVLDTFEEPQPRRPQRRRQDRGVERRIVVAALLGIAAVTALVFVAWRFGGSNTAGSTPAVVRTQGTPQAVAPAAHELVLRGVGKGSYVEVRRGSAAGRVLLQATVHAGGVQRLTGTRFFLYVRAPAGLQVRLGGESVSLPARRNLRVVVTPTRTTRVTG
ncbi:MAG TPA: helix-turn-helix domain-containing protein [Gaiellaceae bacterium]|nr:helix-turn-helix domain-containing protein [Gaiellaceae bacterium]